MESVQQFILAITFFIGNVLIPFLFAVALLVFLFNAARYFIIGGTNEEDREKAKQLSIYAIFAFVFLVSIWGIVNMFVGAFGFARNAPLQPDYIEHQQSSWFNFSFDVFDARYDIEEAYDPRYDIVDDNSGWGNDPRGEFGDTQ